MQAPKPLRRDQLVNPSAKGRRDAPRSKFNGDLIRPASQQGFIARRKAAGHSTHTA